jgi:hypothetical protein
MVGKIDATLLPVGFAKDCMATAESESMAERRALLTEREREIVSGEAGDVSDSYRYQTISRVRKRMEQLEQDLEAMEEHGELAEELREKVCEE